MVRLFDYHLGMTTNLRGPPFTPSRFNKKLLQLQDVAEGKGVRLFTNGLEDMELVERKYADSYNLLTRAIWFQYRARHWSSDDFECLVEALPNFTDLLAFQILVSKLSTDQARRLAVGLLALSGVQNNLHGEQWSQLAWAVCFFLGKGVRSSPFGAALTAAWVANFVAVAAAGAWDAVPTMVPVFAWSVRTLAGTQSFLGCPTLSSSIKFVTHELGNPNESASSPCVPVLH